MSHSRLINFNSVKQIVTPPEIRNTRKRKSEEEPDTQNKVKIINPSKLCRTKTMIYNVRNVNVIRWCIPKDELLPDTTLYLMEIDSIVEV